MNSKKIIFSMMSMIIIISSLLAGCQNAPTQPTVAENTLSSDATPTPTRELAQATPTMDPAQMLSGFTTEIDQDVINILLVGNDSDSPDGDGNGRNDTTMVLQIDRVNKTMKLISFMRDMVFDVPGVGETSLNNAFYHGGANTLSKLLKSEFGINIDYYASVSFGSFKSIMDIIGKITIDASNNVIPDINSNTTTNTEKTLSTSSSLAYVRDRKNPIVDPETGYTLYSDEARNYRQRVFISTVWESVKTFPKISVPVGVYGAITYLDTNMDEATMITLITEMMDANATIETLGLPARRSAEKPYYSLYENLNTEEIVTKSEVEAAYQSASDKDSYTNYEEWKDANFKVSHIIGWNVSRTTQAIKNFLITD